MSVISLLSSLLVLGASLGTTQDTLEEFTTPDGALVVLEKLMIKDPGAPRTTVKHISTFGGSPRFEFFTLSRMALRNFGCRSSPPAPHAVSV